MLRERYVSENPFRLLDVPSNEGYPTLRRKADAAARSAQVGLAPEVPLGDAFGADLDDVPSRVRALATDPELVTLYRMLWPLDDAGAASLVAACEAPSSEPNQPAGIQAVQARYAGLGVESTLSVYAVKAEAALSVADRHGNFLRAYYAFLLNHRVADLQKAVEGITALGTLPDYFKLLRQQLVDDGVDEARAKEAVAAAGGKLVRYVCTKGMMVAADEWTEGRRTEAKRLLDVARSGPFDETDEEAVLAPILGVGDRLASELDLEAPPAPAEIKDPSPRCVEIEELAAAMGRHPSAGRWLDSALDHRTGLAATLRAEAIEIANERNDFARALALTRRALALRPVLNMRRTLKNDVGVLEENLASAKREAVWKDIAPVHSSPTLRTLNGFGCMMYGGARFEPDPRFQLSNFYFTALAFPLFPLARYVVQREGNGYRFFGKAPWTTAMKAHLGASLAATVLGIFWIASSPSSAATTPSYSEPDSSSSSYSSEYDAPSGEATSATPVDTVEPTPSTNGNLSYDDWVKQHGDAYKPSFEAEGTRAKLRKELEELKAEIGVLDTKIDQGQMDLESDRVRLDGAKVELNLGVADKADAQEIDGYNRHVDEYEVMRKRFNEKVKAHNRLVVREKSKVKRHNEILKQLGGESEE